MSKTYLTPKDLTGPVIGTISAIRKEIVDGRPRLVVYFEEQKKGLLLTRELANDITNILGPSKTVDEFFASEGQLQ